MTSEGIAGAIASAVVGGIFLILKLRSMWAGDTRQIANDSNATEWQDRLMAHNERLENRLDEQSKQLRSAETALTDCRIEKRGLEGENFEMASQRITWERVIASKDKEILDLTNELRKYVP